MTCMHACHAKRLGMFLGGKPSFEKPVTSDQVAPVGQTVNNSRGEMHRRRGLIISREQGLRYDAGFAVLVLMS